VTGDVPDGQPFRSYGAIAAPVIVAGLLGLARTRRRATWSLAAIAIGQLVAIGITSHAQPPSRST
jgi:hypothetical protein